VQRDELVRCGAVLGPGSNRGRVCERVDFGAGRRGDRFEQVGGQGHVAPGIRLAGRLKGPRADLEVARTHEADGTGVDLAHIHARFLQATEGSRQGPDGVSSLRYLPDLPLPVVQREQCGHDALEHHEVVILVGPAVVDVDDMSVADAGDRASHAGEPVAILCALYRHQYLTLEPVIGGDKGAGVLGVHQDRLDAIAVGQFTPEPMLNRGCRRAVDPPVLGFISAPVHTVNRSYQLMRCTNVPYPSGSVVHDAMVTNERVSLQAWSEVELRERLSGGARNDAYLAVRHGERLVVRRSLRPMLSLEWELDLCGALSAAGFLVPRPIETDDGRQSNEGTFVTTFLPGRQPAAKEDWERVLAVLRDLHQFTSGYLQRPGFAASAVLLHESKGGDVDLNFMEDADVDLIRRAWRAVQVGPLSVVHGDPGAPNIVMSEEGGVGLLDWDEARVDVGWFDLAAVPESVDLPTGPAVSRQAVITAGVAWEAATSWIAEPDYAQHRMVELRSRQETTG
jgi:aminoglycoside phosphotransferase (APT) family kinase protein